MSIIGFWRVEIDSFEVKTSPFRTWREDDLGASTGHRVMRGAIASIGVSTQGIGIDVDHGGSPVTALSIIAFADNGPVAGCVKGMVHGGAENEGIGIGKVPLAFACIGHG